MYIFFTMQTHFVICASEKSKNSLKITRRSVPHSMTENSNDATLDFILLLKSVFCVSKHLINSKSDPK